MLEDDYTAPLPLETYELIRALFLVLEQSCGRIKEGYRDDNGAWRVDIRSGEPTTTMFDSGYISAYATGIRTLAKLGLVEITEEHGRQVVGEVTQAGREIEASIYAELLSRED